MGGVPELLWRRNGHLGGSHERPKGAMSAVRWPWLSAGEAAAVEAETRMRLGSMPATARDAGGGGEIPERPITTQEAGKVAKGDPYWLAARFISKCARCGRDAFARAGAPSTSRAPARSTATPRTAGGRNPRHSRRRQPMNDSPAEDSDGPVWVVIASGLRHAAEEKKSAPTKSRHS
ncbi:MAG: hypothetical protein MZV70_14225 [Desulfobacterales bacterium]|nr:hypothetical protein [Desulfobacterales bacterium]